MSNPQKMDLKFTNLSWQTINWEIIIEAPEDEDSNGGNVIDDQLPFSVSQFSG